MANLRYCLGPWDRTVDANGERFEPPAGTVGAVDLRPVPEKGTPGVGFFALRDDAAVPRGAAVLGVGNLRELPAGPVQRGAWRTMTGVSTSGDTVAGLLWDHLTAQADPLGFDTCSPLMPTVRGRLELHVPGHVWAVRSETFRFGQHSHTGQVRAVLQSAYQRHHNRDPEHARRVLDYWGEKHGLPGDDVLQLVPPGLRDGHRGRLPHRTTFTDDFNRPDEVLADGPDWSAGHHVAGGGSVLDQRARFPGASPSYRIRNRWVPALSSQDHYAQIVAVNLPGTTSGVHGLVRYSADEQDFYVGRIARAGAGGSSHAFLIQLATNYQGGFGGSLTTLAQVNLADFMPTPFMLRMTADGSTLRLERGAVQDFGVLLIEVLTATDTTLAVSLGTGLAGASDNCDFDDWETADLGLPPGPVAGSVEWKVGGRLDYRLDAATLHWKARGRLHWQEGR